MRLTKDLIRSRVELKYGVAAEDVSALLGRIPADEREEYGISTLYFDRPDWSLARNAIRDPLHCTKVRSREYPNVPSVWFEVKTRNGCWTRKARIQLLRTEAARLFGRMSSAEEEAAPAPVGEQTGDDEAEARRYLWEVVRGGLVPVGTVYAYRQTFILKKPQVRITLDRDIAYFRATAHPYAARGSDMPGLLLRKESEPVLEVKHGGLLPSWCDDLVSGLRGSTYSKFRNLVQSLAESGKAAGRVDRF